MKISIYLNYISHNPLSTKNYNLELNKVFSILGTDDSPQTQYPISLQHDIVTVYCNRLPWYKWLENQSLLELICPFNKITVPITSKHFNVSKPTPNYLIPDRRRLPFLRRKLRRFLPQRLGYSRWQFHNLILWVPTTRIRNLYN